MLKTVIWKMIPLAAIFGLFIGCGAGRKADPILKDNHYKIGGKQNLAFYGKVVDMATHNLPRYRITILISPDDPKNSVVSDSGIFFIQDSGFEPNQHYNLLINANPDYAQRIMPLKYIKGRAQNLGIIELEDKRLPEPLFHNDSLPKTPQVGPGVIENSAWPISSFLDHWLLVNQPFGIDDVEQYIKETPNAPEIPESEIAQSIGDWLKKGLIQAYGHNLYILKEKK
jgi:hypothetical protein